MQDLARGVLFSLSCGRAIAAASEKRIRKPLVAVLITNAAYLAVSVLFASGPSAVWDNLMHRLGSNPPQTGPGGEAGMRIVTIARQTADGTFQAVFMVPMLLIVTVLSTVWWGAMAKPAKLATSASKAPSAAIGAAETAIKVLVLLFVQLEAVVVDGVGRTLASGSLESYAPCITNSYSGALECLASTIATMSVWWWVTGWALRVTGTLGLCAAYSFMAIDPARAALSATPETARDALSLSRLGDIDRLLHADRELLWLIGCGLAVTVVTSATGEWLGLGLHAGTAVYGILYSLLAAVAVGGKDASPALGRSESPASFGLFALNARLASWLIGLIF